MAEAAVEPWVAEAGPVGAVTVTLIGAVAPLIAVLPIQAFRAACNQGEATKSAKAPHRTYMQ